MKRSEFRRKHGSIKKQAFKQGFRDPAVATIHTLSKGIHEFANSQVHRRTLPSKDSGSIDKPPSDVDVSEAGSSHNEPVPPPVGSSDNHFSLEENLPSAPILTINPKHIAAISEEPLLENLDDEGLQNAVVYQNSKLFEKTEGQWVAELLFE